MRLMAITWASDKSLLLEGAAKAGLDLVAWSFPELKDPRASEICRRQLVDCQAVLLHPSSDEVFLELYQFLTGRGKDAAGARDLGSESPRIPVISFGYNHDLWGYSTVPSRIVAAVNTYTLYGGAENIKNMLLYVASEVLGEDFEYLPPREMLWEGLYHPRAPRSFASVEDYLEWYRPQKEHTIGILFFRTYWANHDLKLVDQFIEALENEFNVLPAFCFAMGDRDLQARSSGEVVREFFLGRVDAVINLQSLFHADRADRSVEVLKGLDVSVFHPLTAYHKTREEWMEDVHGLDASEVGWAVAMPEFEGLIEPILAGTGETSEADGGSFEVHAGVPDRISKITARVARWIRLRQKPPEERKVAFILHNTPCASVEANVGTASHLDTLESMARIMKSMIGTGYLLPDAPEDGKALIEDIMARKAVSEFRWTPVEEIVTKGGALHLLDLEDYLPWFRELPKRIQEEMILAWGEPPGQVENGVPAGMVYQGKLVITGVRYGNVVVAVQPKRGCAGARCDGQVCKILHDPKVPPPHQYLATYRYLEHIFGADVVVHVGTHGNLEFLPGKSVALSQECFPDLVLGSMPHLYIYNSDNPPEGTTAKRRSYAVLIDHMQTLMAGSGVYGELKELEDRIGEYNKVKSSEKGRAHSLEHIIMDLIQKSRLAEEMGLKELGDRITFEEIIAKAHEKISEMYSTRIPDGMHIFGRLPEGKDEAEMVASILAYGQSIRKALGLVVEQGQDPEGVDVSRLDNAERSLVEAVLQGKPMVQICRDILSGLGVDPERASIVASEAVEEEIKDLSRRIRASDEMGSLMRGLEGRYIEPGPSGLITRGRPDVLPTGRNFYSLDPSNIPTQSAWMVGRKLADGLLEKYIQDNGRLPENVAIYWMASDIMWADGEGLAQMFHLLGVEPRWKEGRFSGYRIMSLQELGRPRVDITVRVSGITRDCFYHCIEILDQTVREVASLDEPLDMNFPRKHDMEGGSAPRIFASQPGTYGNGVNLAVYASAWKEEKDLTDVFLHWNSYAYGQGIFGQEAHGHLVHQLKTVDLTFNKTVTDEYDLLGCCCYFGTHGGLTNAARELSGHEISSYYGDTRQAGRVDIRTLADEVRRVVRTKLLNPKWIEGMKRHGYKGAGDISKRIGRVYGWEATTREVDDGIFDDIARTFVLDEEMRRFFQENNPWAMEEIGRRLLEANQRGLWKADPEVIQALKSSYLEIEGWMEEAMGEQGGDFQGGSIDLLPAEEFRAWRDRLAQVSGDRR